MGLAVVEGATLRCTMGGMDSTLTGATGQFKVGSNFAATIEDHRGQVNVGMFLMCKATQKICTPITPQPWAGACSSINTGNVPLLSSSATLSCQYGGTISIIDAGQATMSVEKLDPPKDTHHGLFGPIHDGLNFIASLPVPTGPVGAYAAIIDAHIYNFQGDKVDARAQWWSAFGNVIPLKKAKIAEGTIVKVLPKVERKIPLGKFGESHLDDAGKEISTDNLVRIRRARDYVKKKERISRAADYEEAAGQNLIGDVAANESRDSEKCDDK